MIDPRISLAMSVQAGRGVYALLLGSGISKPAGIPSGHELMCDLIRQVARLENAPEPQRPEEWFRQQYGREPTYSGVMEAAGSTRADRSNLLRPYFVPSPDERAQGAKLPTKAHRALARMAREGYLKVAITTNFDPLLEQAMSDEGVARQVISSRETALGRTPLAHAAFTVIKVHGDYVDLATSNTTAELAEYGPEMNSLLDEVLTGYGLIVCGWSGEWDEALRKAIVRNTLHRYGTYWMYRTEASADARHLIEWRKAQAIPIQSADEAFEDLEAKVRALADFRGARPLTAAVAMAEAKRCIAEPGKPIRLDDLVRKETRAVAALLETDFDVSDPPPSNESIRERIEKAESATTGLAAMLGAIGCWGSGDHARVARRALEAIGTFKSKSGTIYPVWERLRFYPACLAMYATGIGAVSFENWSILRLILGELTVEDGDRRRPLAREAAAASVLEPELANEVLSLERKRTPMSDRVAALLKAHLGEVASSSGHYEEAFDTFEILLAMAVADHMRNEGSPQPWIPMGRFVWRCVNRLPSGFPRKDVDISNSWGPLAAGLFGGDVQRAKLAYGAVARRSHHLS